MGVKLNGTTSSLTWVGNLVLGLNAFSLFCWFRPRGTSLSGNAAVVGIGRTGGGTENGALAIGGTSVRVQTRDGSASASAQAAITLSDTWIPVLVTFDVSGGAGSCVSRTIKVGSAPAATDAIGIPWKLPGEPNRIAIGVRAYDESLFLEGDVAEVAVWSGQLNTTTDWAALAGGAAPETVQPGALIEHWKLQSSADLVGTVSRTLTAANITTASSHPIARSGGDTTAPILTSPTGTATGTTTATVGATTNEGNGVLYAYVGTSATPPAEAALKAGTGAAWAGSVVVSSTGAKTLSATGLTASTSYYAHLIHTDAAANDSNIVTSSQFTTAAAAATAITLTGPSGGQVGVASAAFTVGANGAISGSHTVTPSDGGAGGSFSPANVTISAGTPTATFTYTPSTVGARTISATDAGGYTAPTSLTYTATSTAGTLTSSPLKNNTGTLLTGVAFEAFVNNPTSGALVVKKTGLTSSGAGVVTFADGALAAASSYRVVWRRTDTGAEGLETLTAT